MFQSLSLMFQSLWSWIVTPVGYIMRWCYLLFADVLRAPLPYVFAMLLFAIITRLLQFPLSIKQQKQTARMSALNPMMEEIRKKFPKDKNRQNEEMMKLQQEMGISALSGCMPMLIQMPIIFIVVEVIYRPLSYMLFLPKELLTTLAEMVTATGYDGTERFIQNEIISQVKLNFDQFVSKLPDYAAELSEIRGLNMDFFSINLLDTPSISQISLLWLLPIFMIVTMLIQSLFSMKASGQTTGQPGGGKSMMILMSLVFGVFAFNYPAGFSLYYAFTNLIMMGQSAILRKIINPETIKQRVIEEYKAKKKSAKASTVVKVKDEKTGAVVEKKISAAEAARRRLQKARELDEARYADELIEADESPAEYTAKKKQDQ